MSLEDQLSLSRNGGVYYDGTRVDPTDDPILFIGLGGTGADALLRVKNEVQTRMHLPKGDDGRVLRTSPVNISFLAVDTDKDILNKTCGVASFDPSGDELLQISVAGLPYVVGDVINKHIQEPCWDWFDSDITPNGGVDGANGIRQIGRFMLFQNFHDVKVRLETAMRNLIKATGNKNLKVFVLAGIGGGTGSGTFLDIAYLLREIGKIGELAPNMQIQGYIFTPDLNKDHGGDADAMYRNGFASLKELDYWMSIGEHGQHFIQKYPDGFSIDSNAKPFDFCHIITAQDAQEHMISYFEALDAVGSNLFSYIVSEKALDSNSDPALKTMYDNIRDHISTKIKPEPANYFYLSVGSDKLEIPYTEITTLIAARVFEKLEPIFQREPNRDSINYDLNSLQLTYDHLWGYIHKDVVANPLLGKKIGYNDIWPGNAPYNKMFQWLNGHAQQTLELNKKNFTSVAEGLLRKYLEQLLKAPERGPCYAARLILSNTSFCLVRTMEAYRDDCRARVASAASKLPQLKATMQEEFAGGSKAGLFARNSATESYMKALNEYFDTEYAYWGYTALADALDEFRDRLMKYHERIFKRLLDSLTILPDIFKDNLAKIKTDELEAQKKDGYVSTRYLIRPMEFERDHKGELEKKVDGASTAFLIGIAENLQRWVGISMDEIDSDIVSSTDIGGAIAQFINNNFRDTLSMNIERLLSLKLQKNPSPDTIGMDENSFYLSTLKSLGANAIPMFHKGVSYKSMKLEEISMLSIPDDCSTVLAIAKSNKTTLKTGLKSSSERSKIQWVKVLAGMPLYVFPEVVEMEKRYEMAMKTSRETRRGVHLRWSWREELPSPLPEHTWDDPNAPEKKYSKEYNDTVRKAFQKCVDGGIIREAQGGDYAMLYVASPELLNNVELHGTVREKVGQLEMLRRRMWGDEASAVKLEPFGNMHDGRPLMEKVRENVLRFYNVSSEIKRQAGILDKYEELAGGFASVELYVNAVFSNLIYDQGFDRKFRRAETDYAPVKLFDKMSQTAYPDYETFKEFSRILTPEIRANIAAQFDAARRGLLSADGGFNKAAVEQKQALLNDYKERFSKVLLSVRQQIDITPLDQRGELTATADFYSQAIELIEQRQSVIQG